MKKEVIDEGEAKSRKKNKQKAEGKRQKVEAKALTTEGTEYTEEAKRVSREDAKKSVWL